MEEKFNVSHQGALVTQKSKHILGCIKRRVASRLSEMIYSLLFWFDERSTVFSSGVISTSNGKQILFLFFMDLIELKQRRVLKSLELSYAERLRESEVGLTGKKRRLHGGLQCIRGIVRKLETFY